MYSHSLSLPPHSHTIMELIIDNYKGLWRSSAMEKTPYTDDFPEALLVLPEFFDGAIHHGRTKEIFVTFLQNTESEWTLLVRDSGEGIRSESRLLSWAASSSVTTAHRNGHGHKKALTKFAPDYDTAYWRIRWRRSGDSLWTLSGPYCGISTSKIEDAQNATTLMPSGTETEVKFASSLLGRYSDPVLLRKALEEIITTRYDESVLRRVKFTITTHMSEGRTETVDSHAAGAEWHSFRYYVEKGVRDGYIRSLYESAPPDHHKSGNAPWTLAIYKITAKGSNAYELKKKFPTYGMKNIRSQRAHIALGDRIIEATPVYPFLGRQIGHNDNNGLIVFVTFTGNLTSQPQPSTTKVSMYANDEIYKQFCIDLTAILPTKLQVSDTDSDGSGSVAPDYRPAPRVDYKKLIGEALGGLSFHMKDGQILVKFPGSGDMIPVRGFQLVPITD